MTTPQIEILAVLVATVTLFLWGRWRHDLVALTALIACVVLGLVPADRAFLGFGHPAVITVACVLILSRGLQDTGAVHRLTRWLLPRGVGLVAGRSQGRQARRQRIRAAGLPGSADAQIQPG